MRNQFLRRAKVASALRGRAFIPEEGRLATIYELKPRFQRLLRPLSNGLVAAGARPNHVTIAALVLTGAHGLAIAIDPANPLWLLLLPLSFFVRMALNAIDGMMAREHDMKTHAGALLNEAGDVTADAAMIAPLALVDPFPAPLVVAAVILAALTEIVGLAAVGIGATRRYDGAMGKSDRAFAFSVLASLPVRVSARRLDDRCGRPRHRALLRDRRQPGTPSPGRNRAMIDAWLARLDPRLLAVFGGVIAVLIIESVLIPILKRLRPGGDFTKLTLRVRSW